MARMYANSCIKGLKNFNDIPKEMQNAVRLILSEEGYRVNIDGTVVKS